MALSGFTAENELEHLMLRARTGDIPMQAFLQALTGSEVFVGLPEDADLPPGPGEALPLAVARGGDGLLYAPAFTSRSRAERFSAGRGTAGATVGNLAISWPEDVSLVLNPGEPTELVLPGDAVRDLAADERPRGPSVVPAGTTMKVGDPATEPDAVLEAAAAAAARHPEIEAAYRAQIHIERPGEEPHLAIGLLLDRQVHDLEQVHDDIARAATAAGARGVSVLAVTRKVSGNGVADYMVQQTTPFYRRDGERQGEKPPSNPRLSTAMRQAAESGDPAARAGVLAELGDSALIVPIRDGQDGEPEVRAALSPGGEPLLLAFTEEEALRAWASGPVRWASIRGADLSAFAEANSAAGLALNPAGPHGGEVSREEIARLAELTALEPLETDEATGITTMSVRDGAKVRLRPLENPPEGLVAALRKALAGRDEVRRAFLLESVGPGGSHPVIGLRLDPDADPAATARALAPIVAAEHPAAETVDVIPLDDELDARLREVTEPLT